MTEGLTTLCLRIAGIDVVLRSQRQTLRGLAELYRPFVLAGCSEPGLAVELEWASSASIVPDPLPLSLPLVGGILDTAAPWAHLAADNALFRSKVQAAADFLGDPEFRKCLADYHPSTGDWQVFEASNAEAWFLNASGTRAKVFARRRGGNGDGAALDLDGVFYVLMSLALARRRGVLLHAAGVVPGDQAYLFVGPSGSGKTTIARAARAMGWSVLADDGLVVREMPDDSFRAYQTPWNVQVSGWNGASGGTIQSARVRAIFFVEPSAADDFRPLAPAGSAARLVANAYPALGRLESADADSRFGLLARIGGSVSCYELRFRADCAFLKGLYTWA